MSYNGSGTFLINTAGQPVVTGTVISSTTFNTLTADLGTGLSTAITKDGQTTTTSRIPFIAGISSTLTTDSTSVGTGSIITSGGVGIAKALFVGTTANIAGAVTLGGAVAITSSSANALAVGLNGATNPALNVDASTASSATGLNVKSAAAAGGVALSVTSSGSNEALTLNAKGTGTIGIGSVSTGAVTITPATTITGAATLSSTLGVTGVSTLTGGAVIQTLTVGLGAGAVSTNTAVGASALAANTSGSNNVALGYRALTSMSTGNTCVAVGQDALKVSVAGTENTAVGFQSMLSTLTASTNSAFGVNSLRLNTTGGSNTAIGHSALDSNTTASNNTAVGYQAAYSNTTGTRKTAIGCQAGYTGTTNNYATYVGFQAGNISTGEGCTMIGDSAGSTTSSGTYNVFVGQSAGYFVTTGSKNTIIGSYSGNQGGLDIRTASNYIVLSDGDGQPRGRCDNVGAWNFVSSGSGASHRFYGSGLADNSFALYVDKPSATTSSAQYFIGFTTNTQTVGNGMIAGNGASSAAFASFSDARLKENIVELPPQLSNILALRPVEFDYIESAGGGHQTGFIAQEIEAVYPDTVGEQLNGMKTLSGWSKTEARLVKAIQEQQAIIESLKARLDAANL